MLVTLYKIGEVYFRLLGTNGFHEKAEKEKFSAAGSRCRPASNMKISRRRLADYVKKLHLKACRMCSTIIFPRSTNQLMNHLNLWRCRCRSRCCFLNSLITQRVSYKKLSCFASRCIWHCVVHHMGYDGLRVSCYTSYNIP